MNKKISTLSSIAALLLGSSIVNAQGIALPGTIEIPSGSSSYPNAGGLAIRTGLGDCLRLGGFDDENQVNACEGIEDEVVEAVVEAEPAPEPAPAPAPEPVEKAPTVTPVSVSGETLFDTNSAKLNATSEQTLGNLVAELLELQEISSIVVVGHTDATGDEDYNQALSERRAASVEAYFQAAFPEAEVSSSGMGESSPVATNSTREGRSQNRRVELQVTAKSITE